MEEQVSPKIRYQADSEQTPGTEEPPSKRSEKTENFKNRFYPNVTNQEWDDWKWQVRNSITTYEELTRLFGSPPDFDVSEDINLPLRITPYYASTITSVKEGIGKCVVPTVNELVVTQNEDNDSLKEEEQSPTQCIVHRYPDRVLFLATDFCSSNCRYCTRSHMVASKTITKSMWEEAFKYIEEHKDVRDVLVSGGDPLCLSDDIIEYILERLRNIKHIEILRIGTKVPVVLPMRITDNLVNILRKFHPLYINIHFSHPNELTEETIEACNKLANCGIPLGSQTVLLKGVNDDTNTMKDLMHGLLRARVRPYYIYICDQVVGTSHFRTSIDKGLEIMKGLRGHTSGLAVPYLILDSKHGKIPLVPDYFLGRDGKNIRLKNYQGKEFIYCED